MKEYLNIEPSVLSKSEEICLKFVFIFSKLEAIC